MQELGVLCACLHGVRAHKQVSLRFFNFRSLRADLFLLKHREFIEEKVYPAPFDPQRLMAVTQYARYACLRVFFKLKHPTHTGTSTLNWPRSSHLVLFKIDRTPTRSPSRLQSAWSQVRPRTFQRSLCALRLWVPHGRSQFLVGLTTSTVW